MSDLKNKKFLGFGDQKSPEKSAVGSVPTQSKGSFNSLKLIESKAERVTRLPSVSSHPLPSHQNSLPVAPIRDFQKVSNSINRDAIPNGLFKTGASKKIYDVLYGLTRGAINPGRKVNIKKSELMKKCDIGARVTLDAGVSHLQEVGLIKLGVVGGKHVGNEFEVLLPEEAAAESLTRVSSQTRHSSVSDHAYFSDTLDTLENRQSSQAQTIANKDTYSAPKTLIKTIKNDDDEKKQIFTKFIKIINEVNEELTGKNLTEADAESLAAIAEILAAELRKARLKTKSISKPAAFLAAHLQTRLLNPKTDVPSVKLKPDVIGKSEQQRQSEIDLSDYTPEELAKLEQEFCLKCGNTHTECECQKNVSRGQ